jgi:hypothetical protein
MVTLYDGLFVSDAFLVEPRGNTAVVSEFTIKAIGSDADVVLTLNLAVKALKKLGKTGLVRHTNGPCETSSVVGKGQYPNCTVMTRDRIWSLGISVNHLANPFPATGSRVLWHSVYSLGCSIDRTDNCKFGSDLFFRNINTFTQGEKTD